MNIQLPPLFEKQQVVADTDSRWRAVTCGRRFGKTMLGVWLSARELLRGKRGWWVAPTYKDCRVGWRELTALLRPIPGINIKKFEKTIEFRQAELQARSASRPDSLRSEGLDFLILDEAALMEQRVLDEVLMPALMDRDGWCITLTTPRGKNWYYNWQSSEEVANWRHPSWHNPHLDPNIIKLFKKKMPEKKFKQEIEAQFVDFEGKIFPPLPQDLPPGLHAPAPDAQYVAGIDWGRINDYTVIALIDINAQKLVNLVRMQGPYDQQLGKVHRVLSKWQPVHVYAESNSMGQALLDQLQSPASEASGAEDLIIEGFATTSQSKPAMIDNLCVALERGELELMEDDQLRREFEVFRYKETLSDSVKYESAEGEHDDIVIAVALAWLSYCENAEPYTFSRV